MITTQHPVSGEDLMAFLDGELPGDQAQAISSHVEHCAECKLVVEEIESTSALLRRWSVPEAPAALDEAILSPGGQSVSGKKQRVAAAVRLRNRWKWALGGVGAALAVALILSVSVTNRSVSVMHRPINLKEQSVPERQVEALMASSSSNEPSPSAPLETRSLPDDAVGLRGLMKISRGVVAPAPQPMGLAAAQASAAMKGKAPAPQPAIPTPMIARTIALAIQVKDLPATRATLDSILMRYHGYAAQLTINTAENTARAFQGSLRIPANQLAAAIAELRALGKVETESQSGEEVTQQHADLVARLQNSRETEQRLRALLAERTGKIDDVLQVEEEMARVRGEIEQMTADQQALEHRVDFATIDLQLTEQYTAALDSGPPSVGNKMHNAFVAGISHAAALLLGIVLWFEEFGPALLIVAVILVLPGMLLLRRYRRMQGKV